MSMIPIVTIFHYCYLIICQPKFAGDPHSEVFIQNIAPPAPGLLYSISHVIPQPKGTLETVHGWRCFDVRSTHYDSTAKRNRPFTIRWYIPDKKRWQNTAVPNVGSIVQLSGTLLDRHAKKMDSELFPALAAVILGLDFLSIHQTPETPTHTTSNNSPKCSLWGNSTMSPPKRPRHDPQGSLPQGSLPPSEDAPPSSQLIWESSSTADFTSVEETPPPTTSSNRLAARGKWKSRKVSEPEVSHEETQIDDDDDLYT